MRYRIELTIRATSKDGFINLKNLEKRLTIDGLREIEITTHTTTVVETPTAPPVDVVPVAPVDGGVEVIEPIIEDAPTWTHRERLRNAVICQLARNGFTGAKIGRKFHLSRQRVNQILHANGIKLRVGRPPERNGTSEAE